MKDILKTHKPTYKKLTYSCHLLKFGSFGIKVLQDVRLTTEQITSIERFLQKTLKKVLTPSKRCKV